MVCGYVLMPVAYLMGVDWADAGLVGELIGIKTFLNEFIAYSDLSTYIKNREDCLDGTVLSVSAVTPPSLATKSGGGGIYAGTGITLSVCRPQ